MLGAFCCAGEWLGKYAEPEESESVREEGQVMGTSGVEESGIRLLSAFYDLSGHNPTVPVPLGDEGAPADQSAAKTAGIEPGSTECGVAVRYLLNQKWIKETAEPNVYNITVMGVEKVRQERGLG